MVQRSVAIALAVAIVSVTAVDGESTDAFFKRGDANGDGHVGVSDAVTTLLYLFRGARTVTCEKAADTDDNGSVALADAIVVLTYLFRAGERPREPFSDCGLDPTADALSCDLHSPCQGAQFFASLDLLETIAGTGAFRSRGFNGWEERFEGQPATEVELSRPHFAMKDTAGEVWIADKDAHAIRKITTDGQIVTVAGTNAAGDWDEPGAAASLPLSSPNGLWVAGTGVVSILDLGNSKIRRLDPATGMMSTLFAVTALSVGRGLWVSDDETLAYVSSGTEVLRWTPEGGVEVFASEFSALGNLIVDPDGQLVVTDRGGNRVYRLAEDGTRTVIAGNGDTSGGGDGFSALETGLWGVRGIWFVPEGGFLLATHEGGDIWYVDPSGLIHKFLNGDEDHSHTGDGENFQTPGFKISEARAVTMDSDGNVIVTENDFGFIRVVRLRS